MVRLVAIVLVLGACSSVELAAPRIRHRLGPAAGRPVKRLVALPATCGTLETVVVRPASPSAERVPAERVAAECSGVAVAGIDQIVRAAFDFSGFEVIDAERVNAVTATHHEVEQRQQSWGNRTTTQTGARFDDATPFEQADILRELRVDAVLTTRVWVGAGVGIGGRRSVSVQLRLAAASDRVLVWAHRCDLEVGGLMATDDVAIERATRCAVKGLHPR